MLVFVFEFGSLSVETVREVGLRVSVCVALVRYRKIMAVLPESGSVVGMTVDQVTLLIRHHLFFQIERKNKAFFVRPVNIVVGYCVPGGLSKASDTLAVFSSDKDQSVCYVVTLFVELRSCETISRSSIQQRKGFRLTKRTHQVFHLLFDELRVGFDHD